MPHMYTCHKTPQFSNKKPAGDWMPDAPLQYLEADSLKQPGAEAKGGTGVRKIPTRQYTKK